MLIGEIPNEKAKEYVKMPELKNIPLPKANDKTGTAAGRQKKIIGGKKNKAG